MDQKIDVLLAELMASRLCHDLVGPIGAVNNGLELLEEEEPGMGDDAIQLAADSAHRAAVDLRYFRLAYGAAGTRATDLNELRKLAEEFLSLKKTKLVWPGEAVPEASPRGFGKLLLNIIALAREALPLGGDLSIDMQNGSGKLNATVTATGDHAELRQEVAPALEAEVPPDDLTAHNVHAYFTRMLAQRMGSELVVESGQPNRLCFSVTVSA